MIIFSGRCSSEMILKIARMNIPVVVAKSVPTTYAINIAKKFGITLAGRLTADSFCVYTWHRNYQRRIRQSSAHGRGAMTNPWTLSKITNTTNNICDSTPTLTCSSIPRSISTTEFSAATMKNPASMTWRAGNISLTPTVSRCRAQYRHEHFEKALLPLQFWSRLKYHGRKCCRY